MPQNELMLWDVRAWRADPAIQLLSPLARGVWFELLQVMHEAGRVGELRGTSEQLATLARCQPADLALTLTELATLRAADVTERNGTVTVTNRRMSREHKAREATRLRVQRYRKRGGAGPPVTPDVTFPLKVQGLGFKASLQEPLTAETFNGSAVPSAAPPNGSGLNDQGFSGFKALKANGEKLAAEFWEGWMPETEADFIDLMNALVEEMENWGGRWRNRWRANAEACRSALAEFRVAARLRIIDKPGGWLDSTFQKLA